MNEINQSLLIAIPLWAFAYGRPECSGTIKSQATDFIVEEQLSFQPEGSGEHVFIQIQKSGENTEYVARLLARFSGVRQRDVSYAGLKDRHAITTQWFSVWLPGKQDPDWALLETEQIKVLQTIRHARKLKRGVLSANRFQILVRDVQGDKKKLEQQLQLIKECGFPNYFGSQRFGHQGQNINKALEIFQGRKVKREQRSIYLSATRSYLFNQLLAKRVQQGIWNQVIEGDCCVFDQSNSYFKVEQLDDSVIQRIKKGEIHPTGMMFGKGNSETLFQASELEHLIIKNNETLAEGLIKFDLAMNRRALRVFAKDFCWEFRDDSNLQLSFLLPSGCYATALLRELITNI